MPCNSLLLGLGLVAWRDGLLHSLAPPGAAVVVALGEGALEGPVERLALLHSRLRLPVELHGQQRLEGGGSLRRGMWGRVPVSNTSGLQPSDSNGRSEMPRKSKLAYVLVAAAVLASFLGELGWHW